MKVPAEIIAKYPIHDGDTVKFLEMFDEPKGSCILEVGAHDEAVANMLTDAGYNLTGVDLREYNPNDSDNLGPKPPCNYDYIRADFCNLPWTKVRMWGEWFDSIISLSCIEHFGLGTYQEGPPHPYYDVIAMRTAWQLLKEGGHCYVTVPYGVNFVSFAPHWRVYDRKSLKERIIQDFEAVQAEVFVADFCIVDGKPKKWGDPITWQEAEKFSGNPPHVSILLKLKKVPVNRLAPNGR